MILAAMFFQQLQLSPSLAGFGVLITALGVAGTYIATVKAGGRTEGKIETLLKGFKEDLVALRQTDRDQWKKLDKIEEEVGDLGQRTARIEGRMNGNGRAASAGGPQ